jgi:hypothetical protein
MVKYSRELTPKIRKRVSALLFAQTVVGSRVNGETASVRVEEGSLGPMATMKKENISTVCSTGNIDFSSKPRKRQEQGFIIWVSYYLDLFLIISIKNF